PGLSVDVGFYKVDGGALRLAQPPAQVPHDAKGREPTAHHPLKRVGDVTVDPGKPLWELNPAIQLAGAGRHHPDLFPAAATKVR
ncbi:hypothetical protein, partial [Mycobacterium avium]|uniref:hypothetical protein n=1 Tax=Mycobacterium avium TaxID=1764 RepID=UPI00373FDAE3